MSQLTPYIADLHPGNVLVALPWIDKMSGHDIQYHLGGPFERPNIYRDRRCPVLSPHLAKYLVRSPHRLDLLIHSLLHTTSPSAIDPKICDFGESLILDLKSKSPLGAELNTPPECAPPEVLFCESITPASDIWTLGAFMHNVLSGPYVLCPSRDGLLKQILYQYQMVLKLGKLPDRYWKRWYERREYFDEDVKWVGAPRVFPKFIYMSPDRMVDGDRGLLEKVLKKMVVYEPEDRISAEEVVGLIPENWLQEDTGACAP